MKNKKKTHLMSTLIPILTVIWTPLTVASILLAFRFHNNYILTMTFYFLSYAMIMIWIALTLVTFLIILFSISNLCKSKIKRGKK